MDKTRNDAFLILRIPTSWKEQITIQSVEANKDVSKYVREGIKELFKLDN